MSNRKKKKMGFVPYGRAIYWIVLLLFLLCCFCSAIVLLDEVNETNLATLLGALFVLIPLLSVVLAKYPQYIILSDNMFFYKKKKYEWKNIYITVDYRSPTINRNFYEYIAYFSDHYLTPLEIQSKEFKKKGIFLILTPKRIAFLLPIYRKKIKILRICPDDLFKISSATKDVLAIIKKHNLEQEYCESFWD